MNTVLLASPFGTVQFRFHSPTQAAVVIGTPGPVVVNGVKLEGVLQFELKSHTWVYLKHDSYIDRADNHKAASEAIHDKLTKILTALLNEWYRSNPAAFKGIKLALLQQKLTEGEKTLQELQHQLQQQQAVVDDLRQQHSTLIQVSVQVSSEPQAEPQQP